MSLRLLDWTFKVDYRAIDMSKFEEWAYRSFDDPGWRSYFAYEDLKILKSLGQGPERDKAMVLIGRRLQLLYLFNEMESSFEKRKAAQERKAAENLDA